MMKDEIRKLLQELKEGLETLYGDRLRGVYLFGSHARGEADKESDVDVAVVLDNYESDWEEIQRTSHLVADLSIKYGVTLVPLTIREEKWREDDFPLFINIRREGIKI